MNPDLDRPEPDWLLYERGELNAEEAQRVERNLDATPDGRARLELLKLLRANAGSPVALERAGGCPDEFGLAALAEGQLAEEAAQTVREHVARCGHCALLVEAALEEVAAIEAERAQRRAQSKRSGFSLLTGTPVRIAAAAALLIATTLLWIQSPSWQGAELAQLAQVETLPVRIPRGAAEEGAARRHREALMHYDAGRFAEALAEFSAALELDEHNAETALYLGSTYLQVDRPSDAIDVLRSALPNAGEALAPEILWQLAQAALLVNDGRWAREILMELEPSGGPHAKAARALLVQLRD